MIHLEEEIVAVSRKIFQLQVPLELIDLVPFFRQHRYWAYTGRCFTFDVVGSSQPDNVSPASNDGDILVLLQGFGFV